MQKASPSKLKTYCLFKYKINILGTLIRGIKIAPIATEPWWYKINRPMALSIGEPRFFLFLETAIVQLHKRSLIENASVVTNRQKIHTYIYMRE